MQNLCVKWIDGEHGRCSTRIFLKYYLYLNRRMKFYLIFFLPCKSATIMLHNINYETSCLSNFSGISYYMNFSNPHTDDYFLSRLPIVEKRLAQAGVRLAATLNRIFTPRPLIAQEWIWKGKIEKQLQDWHEVGTITASYAT